MQGRWFAAALLAALLAGCAVPPVTATPGGGPWNGGVWNSVLGYHGPHNVLVGGGPSP